MFVPGASVPNAHNAVANGAVPNGFLAATIFASLSLVDADDALAGAGTVRIAAGLSLTDATDTLSGAGNARNFAGLSLTDATDALVGVSKARNFAGLNLLDESDSMVGFVGASIKGSLNYHGGLFPFVAGGSVPNAHNIIANGLVPNGLLPATDFTPVVDSNDALESIGRVFTNFVHLCVLLEGPMSSLSQQQATFIQAVFESLMTDWGISQQTFTVDVGLLTPLLVVESSATLTLGPEILSTCP